MIQNELKNFTLALAVTIFALLIVIFPKESLEASKYGLNMWWNVVFPSLLPFFIASELLIGYGVVRLIGVLLEPLMRPLFRVPGVGGFVWAMGMASGFPAGAKFTARLRQEKQITRIEAERLVSFTNCSNPLFIFAAVSIGFFQNEKLGLLLITTHYLSNFCVGIFMRFYGREHSTNLRNDSSPRSFQQTLTSITNSPRHSVPPLGKMLGDAVIHSIQTLLMIGGFIILFSVINKMLTIIGFSSIVGSFIGQLFTLMDAPQTLGVPFFSGLFEITLGSKLISESDSTILSQAMVMSFILAFSGLSVQAQVASILANTDIRFRPFFIARILQGVFAALFTKILFIPLYIESYIPVNILPVFSQEETNIWHTAYQQLIGIGPLVTLTSLFIYIILYWKRLKVSS